MQIAELDTPCVLIDEAVLDRNITRAQEHCARHGIAMRPHIKTLAALVAGLAAAVWAGLDYYVHELVRAIRRPKP